MGTGFHGGFGNTNGAKAENAPVQNLRDVRYSKKKTEGYLLNTNHPVGGAKAKFMKDVLGYSQSDAKQFHKNVVVVIQKDNGCVTHKIVTVYPDKKGKRV